MALAMEMTDEVAVGPFRVADRTAESVVDSIVDLALTKGQQTVVACYALHVQGLNLRSDPEYVEAMNSADLVYADGGSVVLLARVAGAENIERAATTDIGWEVLARLTQRLGAPPRVALIGGEPGLSARAADVLRNRGLADPVLVEHGFHHEWEGVVARIRDLSPQLILLGLGSPYEMKWVRQWEPHLGTGTVVTCGGWFGFIAGAEKRAPTALRRPGLEWIARLSQSPSRLAPRYARGLASTLAVAPSAIRQRHRSPDGTG
jgi:N-acetylglucosaminyldiphosphoundecaprenol N-acetyl-beta-D-mannosaminyltransferase